MDKFEFEPETHTYKLNGFIIPSVTQILKDTGFYDYGKVNQMALQRAAKFGTAVHEACALDDKDNLGDCNEALMPYVQAWRKFKKDYGSGFGMIEKRMYSKKWGFAGTPDRFLFRITGELIDIKTGQREPWHSLQTAGYKILIEENSNPKLKIKKKLVVHLKENDYCIHEHKEKSNEDIFLSALLIWHWKRNNKIKGENHDARN